MIVWLGVWGGDGGSQVGQHPRLLAHWWGKCADGHINTQGRAHQPHTHGQIYKNDWFDDHQPWIIDEFEENARHYEGHYSHFKAPIRELRLYVSFTGNLCRKRQKTEEELQCVFSVSTFVGTSLCVFSSLIEEKAGDQLHISARGPQTVSLNAAPIDAIKYCSGTYLNEVKIQVCRLTLLAAWFRSRNVSNSGDGIN